MKGGRASPAIRPPLTAPTAAPAATPASAATAAEPVAFMLRAVTTDAKAIAEPTERSIPPERITKVMPRAQTPTMTDCVRIVFAL